MNNLARVWFPRLLCFVLAFAFWYAVKSDLGKNRDFFLFEWKKFIDTKSQSSRLMDTPSG